MMYYGSSFQDLKICVASVAHISKFRYSYGRWWEMLLKYTAVSIGIFQEGAFRCASHITRHSEGVLFKWTVELWRFCLENSGTNFPVMRHHIPEDWGPHVVHCTSVFCLWNKTHFILNTFFRTFPLNELFFKKFILQRSPQIKIYCKRSNLAKAKATISSVFSC